MAAPDVLVSGAGAVVVWIGLHDAFLTILHPDRDGRLSYALNRGIWRATAFLAILRPRQRQAILGMAGPAMVIADILLWMVVPILGYALLMWPAMGDGIRLPAGVQGSFADALYFSGATFTTLGYGDVSPVTRPWEMVAVAEALTGFLVMGTSVTYIIAVFDCVDKRDARALQVYSETGGTWDAAELLRRCMQGGDEALRRRLEEWGVLVRDLHGRLYRFHGLALYVRTQGLDFGPERMLRTVADVAVRAMVLTSSPRLARLRPAADQLAVGVGHFAAALVRRNGRRGASGTLADARPGPEDAALVRRLWQETLAEEPGVADAAPLATEDPAVLLLAAKMRVFLVELDRLMFLGRLERAAAAGGPLDQ